MRSVRLAAAILIAAAVTACSAAEITAPPRGADGSVLKDDATCRAGYIAQSGRCVPL